MHVHTYVCTWITPGLLPPKNTRARPMNVYTLFVNVDISFYSMKILTGTEENHIPIRNTTYIETSHDVAPSHTTLCCRP